MAISASRVTATTSAAVLAGPDAGDWPPVIIRNRGVVAVYLGGSDVTSATGWQLDAGESLAVDLAQGESVYGITASSTAVCHILVGRA